MPDNILDHPAVSGRYLFPQSRRVESPFMVAASGAILACYRHVINPDGYTVLFFHGNGEAVADYVPWMAESFAELGWNSLFVEYRAYGGSTGKAQVAAMLGDGSAALQAAGIPPSRAIAFGRSIGSLYALELVHRHPDLAGLILESGIADPYERFLLYADLSDTGLEEADLAVAARQQFNHREKLAGFHNPVLILHTIHDHIIDISHASRNYEWSDSPTKRLVRFAQGDHNTIMAHNMLEYWRSIRDFAGWLPNA